MLSTTMYPPPQNTENLGCGPLVMGLTWTFTGLAIITTLLRLYVRRRIGPRLAVDDWLMLGAMLLQLVAQIFISVAFKYGLGKHRYDFTITDQLVTGSSWEWYSVPPELVSAMFGCVSICILLVRLFGVHVWFRPYAITISTFGVMASILVCVCLYFSRHPHAYSWNPYIPGATEWDTHIFQDLTFISQSFYILADLTLVVIPIFIIWRLNMAMSRRLGLTALMAFEFFTCSMSIMKGISAISGQEGADTTYPATLSLLWATSEQACVVFLGNLAPLRPLFKLDIPILRSLSQSIASLLGRLSSQGTSKPSAPNKPPAVVIHNGTTTS